VKCGGTFLLTKNNVILDLIALALPVLAVVYGARYWRVTVRIAVVIAFLSLRFTPLWNAVWMVVTRAWS
jgi:hypothetical protein